jgi:hypothetical protein
LFGLHHKGIEDMSKVRLALAYLTFFILLSSEFGSANHVRAQDDKDPKDKSVPYTADETDEESETEKEAREIKLAISQVAGFFSNCQFEGYTKDEWATVPIREKPVMTFSDPTRFDNRGSVWVWGTQGRPNAVAEIYHKGEAAGWILVGVNVSGGRIKATHNDAPWWRENESITKFKDLPDAPVPADKSVLRQRQIRALSQRFTAHEFWIPGNSRYELRLVDRPLMTYKDEANGILDGAMFTFANGTNPEVLVLLEVRADPDKKKPPRFQVGIDRLTHAEIHVLFDEKEVYSVGRGWQLCAPDKPYFSAEISELEARPKSEE